MNRKANGSSSLIIVALTAIVAAHGHAADAGHTHHAAPAVASSPAARTAAEVWRLVKTRESEIRALVVARKLGELHRLALSLRDLVARLPAVSGNLPDTRRVELASHVRYVATLADRLDKAGDSGNQSAAEASVNQLAAVLGAIEALYPPGALGLMAPPADGRATITGEIVDATCYLEKGDAGRGPAHRDCAVRCIAEGRPPFVRDEATGQLYLASFPDSTPEERARWLAQVGNRVHVTGRVEDRDGMRLLEVEELRGEHDHAAAPHGGVVGMAGEHHLEVVTTAENEIRVYLLDGFMKPLPVAGMKGSALVEGNGARRAVLTPDTRGGFLQVAGTRLTPGDERITVTLDLEPAPLTMTLPFHTQEAALPQAGEASPAPHHHHAH